MTRGTFRGLVYGTPGLPGLYARNHSLRRLYDEGDEGGDGGAGAGGATGGESTGDPGGVAGAGGGGAQAHTFDSDDALVSFKGLDKPVSVKDLRAALSARTKHEQGFQTLGQIAQALRATRGQTPAQKKEAAPQRRAGDKATDNPFTELEGLQTVDGKSLSKILQHVMENAGSKNITTLAEGLKQVHGVVSGMQQRTLEFDFGGDMGKALDYLKLPKADGAEILSEVARDLFQSYDEADHAKLKGETFNKLFKERVDSLRKYFKSLDKAELHAAQERNRKRIFSKPGSNTTANGKPAKRMSNQQLADALFEETSAT